VLYIFSTCFFKGLCVDSLKTAVCTVKILAVDMRALSLDAVIDMMMCFPCLEKLYIEVKVLRLFDLQTALKWTVLNCLFFSFSVNGTRENQLLASETSRSYKIF
jgi:hypothetical protein